MTQKLITDAQLDGISGSKVSGNISGNAANVTGTVAIANGGTGQTTQTAAFDALAPTTTAGDLIYHDGTDNVRLGIGSAGQVLTVSGSAPTWAAASGGGSVYYKDPVRVATTAAGTLSTSFENGDVIDGITLATGDRILIKNQSSAVENGIYTVNASGAPTRASDMDADSEAQRGVVVYVQYGNVNGGSNFQLTSASTDPVVIGSTNLYWMPLQGIAGYSINSWTAPRATGNNAISIGNGAQSGTNSVSIGAAQSAAGTCVAIGPSVNLGTSSNPSGVTALGSSINWTGSEGSSAILIGVGAGANSDSTTGQGRQVVLIGKDAMLSGQGASNVIANSVGIGNGAAPEMPGEFVMGSTYFALSNDSKISFLNYRQITSGATATEIGTNIAFSGSTTNTNRIVLRNDSSYIFDCDIIARNTGTDTESKAWNLKFAIRRGTNAANTALIGSATKTVIGEDTGTSGWDVSVTADTTNGRPNISVTGEASKTIRWVANIRMTKVSG